MLLDVFSKLIRTRVDIILHTYIHQTHSVVFAFLRSELLLLPYTITTTVILQSRIAQEGRQENIDII